jgi:hypothetical protein
MLNDEIGRKKNQKGKRKSRPASLLILGFKLNHVRVTLI